MEFSANMLSLGRRLQADLETKTGGMGPYAGIVAAGSMIILLIILLWILVKCISVAYHGRMETRVQNALSRRRNTNDKFRMINGYSWDYVLAFPIHDDDTIISVAQRTYNTKRVLAQLASGGLQIRMFYNTRHNAMYCKVRASQHRLMKEAVRTGMRLQLDPTKLQKYCEKGRDDKGWGPLNIPEKSPITSIPPYMHISAPYMMDAEGVASHPVLKELYRQWTLVQLAKPDQIETPMHRDSEGEGDERGSQSKLLDQGHLISGGYVASADGDISRLKDKISNFGTNKNNDDGFRIVHHTSIFRPVDRLKLINSIIQDFHP